MKTIQMIFIVVLFFLTTTVYAGTPVTDFSGTWENIDANAEEITTVAITVNSGNVKVRGFGACSPRDCDWGEIKGTYFNNGQYDMVSANYKFNNGNTKQLVMRRSGDKLIVKVHTTFPNSPKTTTNHYTMKKQDRSAAILKGFLGNWVNIDPNTKGITKLNLTAAGNAPFARGFKYCSPRDCDLGKEKGTLFNNGQYDMISVNYNFDDGSTTQLVIRRSGSQLIVKSHSTFPRGRKPQTFHYTMKRA